MKLRQDATIFSAALERGSRVPHELQPDRHAWIQIVRESVQLNGIALSAGDGAAIVDDRIVLTASSASEALLIDVA